MFFEANRLPRSSTSLPHNGSGGSLSLHLYQDWEGDSHRQVLDIFGAQTKNGSHVLWLPFFLTENQLAAGLESVLQPELNLPVVINC